MNVYQPRESLPDVWAQRAACPVCRQKNLSIIHAQNMPDRMACEGCGVTFEIALDNTHMRLINLPDHFERPVSLPNGWTTASDIRAMIDKQSSTPVNKTSTPAPVTAPPPAKTSRPPAAAPVKKAAPPPPPAAPQEKEILTQEEVSWHASELSKLGNLPTSISATLKRQGATTQQIQTALNELKRAGGSRSSGKRSTNALLIISIVLVVLCLSILCISAALSSGVGTVPTPTPGI